MCLLNGAGVQFHHEKGMNSGVWIIKAAFGFEVLLWCTVNKCVCACFAGQCEALVD